MAKSPAQVDVLVLGDHPAAYLAAALLRLKSKYRILHACLPDQRLADRLVLINPAFYSLHPLLDPLRRKLSAKSVYGLRFLADDPATSCESRDKSTVATIAHLKDLRVLLRDIAANEGVELLNPAALQVHRIDDAGVELSIGDAPVHPRALILASPVSPPARRVLGIPDEWERGVIHRYSWLRLRAPRMDLGARPLVPMSLDLRGMLCWGWLLATDRYIQLSVEQPLETIGRTKPAELLQHWADTLHRHQVVKAPLVVDPVAVEGLDMPLAGALTQEGVASRTLLIGPAAGFYTASGEDIYPNCWSTLHAADTLRKALREPHLQDALQPYRQRWRATLGDYLRGPQQNLRYLLPLIYRNPIMTRRLAEAILSGKSVIR